MGSKTLLKTKLPTGWRKQTCNCDLEDLTNTGGKPSCTLYTALQNLLRSSVLSQTTKQVAKWAHRTR